MQRKFKKATHYRGRHFLKGMGYTASKIKFWDVDVIPWHKIARVSEASGANAG